ncbi:hypothetical protein D623_10019734 [Myotis brandtii]|uniref:Uncharacterized protein n=1 Tax=Myotis brandtii TaxID=109478 RepID=S7NNY9_MYOBR|nr:hypothetical protein D623_10019734 [Myotis brandtii]
MLRSKQQQNQPNKTHPPRPGPACRRHREEQSAAPTVGPRRPGLPGKSRQDLIFVANCASGGDGRAAGTGRGQLSIPQLGLRPRPVTLCLALGPALPHAMPPTPVSCKPGGGVCRPLGLSHQQPWGPTPTPRADVVPELGGAQGLPGQPASQD